MGVSARLTVRSNYSTKMGENGTELNPVFAITVPSLSLNLRVIALSAKSAAKL